jgi:hypothetical protein
MTVQQESRCGNCDTPLTGPFCHACGQEAGVHLESLRGFLADILRDVAHLDSRAVRTLTDLLLWPGRLTATYFRGQRRRYIKPVQLYLIAAALFFFVNALHPFIRIDPESLQVEGKLGLTGASAGMGRQDLAPVLARGMTPELLAERFRTIVAAQLTGFLVAVVVLFALVLWAFHLRSQRNLLLHGVFALHWTAFFLLLMMLDRLVGLVGVAPRVAQSLIVAVALVYLAVAVRTVYRQSWPVAAAKAIGLLLVFYVLLGVWMVSAIGFAITWL